MTMIANQAKTWQTWQTGKPGPAGKPGKPSKLANWQTWQTGKPANWQSANLAKWPEVARRKKSLKQNRKRKI